VTDGLDGRARLRLAELDVRLDGAATDIEARSPEAAGSARAGLRDLRERLQRVHEACAEIDERTWRAYTTGLDRGLAQLADELADAPAPAADDLVYAHAGRLEVDGWVLRLDLAGRDAPVEGRELVAGAAREIDEYHATVLKGVDPSRAEVERALNELRGAAD
jgi:hypothetical protein